MEIKDIQSSGILEQYVLGVLPETEVTQVEQYIQQYPEIKTEVQKIESALERYAQQLAITPDPALEASILYKIIAIEAAKTIGDKRPSESKTTTSTPTKSSGSGSVASMGAVIAGVLLAGSLFWGYTQSQELKNNQNQLAEVNGKYELLTKDCSKLQAAYQTEQEQIAFLQDFSTQPIVMKGTDKAPNALAAVYWNIDKKKSYLNTRNMPDLATDKQYQLWAIVDGKPVDMGVFDVAAVEGELIEVPFIESPQAFAVTVEKKGGSPTPTLEEMVVIGENT